jgi:hypothetical protein
MYVYVMNDEVHLLVVCCAHNQQCSALCYICSSTTCERYIFSAILKSIKMYKYMNKSWCCLLPFSFIHLPSHLSITVHKILLHFSLLPSIFFFYGVDFAHLVYAELSSVLHMLNITELNNPKFTLGRLVKHFNMETKISNLNFLKLICKDQWHTTV